jgi:S-adenosylmethionine hydrolase
MTTFTIPSLTRTSFHPTQPLAAVSTRTPQPQISLGGEPGQVFTSSQPRFGTQLNYKGPYTSAIIGTDFADGLSNLRAEEAFEATTRFVQNNAKDIKAAFPDAKFSSWANKSILRKVADFFVNLFKALLGLKSEGNGTLPVKRFSDIPFGHRDYGARAVQELAFSRHNDTKDKIYVPVVDPGVGNGNDRAILITQNHGLHVGPNNGLWGLFIRSLDEKIKAGQEKPYEILPINLEKVRQLDGLRLNDPDYYLHKTFHGRDVFAVVAGAIAGGLDPHFFVDTARKKDYKPVFTEFSQGIEKLPQNKGEEILFHAFKDNTGGNVLTNIAVPPVTSGNPVPEGWTFDITSAEDKGFAKPLVKDIPLKEFFDQVGKGQPLIYPGSTHSPFPKSRFLEFAINGGAGNIVLNLEPGATHAYRIRRTA